MGNVKVLLIQDSKDDRMAFKRFIKVENIPYDYDIAKSLSEANKILRTKKFDIIIIDHVLRDGTPFDILNVIINTPIIVSTEAGGEEAAVKLMRAGAYGYLIKDKERHYLKVIPIAIENALKRKEYKKRLKLLSHVVMNVNDSIYVTDMNDNIVFVNKVFLETYGYEEEEIIGQKSIILGEVGWKGEYIQKRKNGSELPVMITKSTVVLEEKENEYAFVIVARDIKERKTMEETISHMARHDALTGLPNQLLFNDHLRIAMSQADRSRKKVAVIMLDLDDFKSVNSKLGHNVGDLLLQAVAKRLKTFLRKSDTVARIGGDEFVIMLSEIIKEADASNITKKVLDTFKKQFIFDDYTLNITASIGITIYPTDGNNADTLVRNADIAMNNAKKIGGNTYYYFHTMKNIDRMVL
jgi:diguanylate cyclase (GGDEF)-like protein